MRRIGHMQALRLARRAERRAEVHERLVEVEHVLPRQSASDIAHRCLFMAWLFGSPLPMKTRNNTRATLVSRIAARSRNAKLRIAPAV